MLGIPDVWVCVCYEGYLVVVLFAVSKENQPWQAAVVFSLVLFEGTHAHTHTHTHVRRMFPDHQCSTGISFPDPSLRSHQAERRRRRKQRRRRGQSYHSFALTVSHPSGQRVSSSMCRGPKGNEAFGDADAVHVELQVIRSAPKALAPKSPNNLKRP